jgi:hypothetical protein
MVILGNGKEGIYINNVLFCYENPSRFLKLMNCTGKSSSIQTYIPASQKSLLSLNNMHSPYLLNCILLLYLLPPSSPTEPALSEPVSGDDFESEPVRHKYTPKICCDITDYSTRILTPFFHISRKQPASLPDFPMWYTNSFHMETNKQKYK